MEKNSTQPHCGAIRFIERELLIYPKKTNCYNFFSRKYFFTKVGWTYYYKI